MNESNEPTIYTTPAPHTFLRSDELLKRNYGRSTIRAQGPILILGYSLHTKYLDMIQNYNDLSRDSKLGTLTKQRGC